MAAARPIVIDLTARFARDSAPCDDAAWTRRRRAFTCAATRRSRSRGPAGPRARPGVARRLLSRVVFEDRDDLDGVRGLSKAAAARSSAGDARLDAARDRGPAAQPGGPVREVPVPRGATARRSRPCASRSRSRATACASRRRSAARWPARSARRAGSASRATSSRGRSSSRCWRCAARRRTGPSPASCSRARASRSRTTTHVMRAAAVLRDPCGLRIRGDRITISTVGLLPQIERYTEEGHPYRLILSLTSAFGEKRAGLMPDRPHVRRARPGRGRDPPRAPARRRTCISPGC